MTAQIFSNTQTPVANAILNGDSFITSTRRRSYYRGTNFDDSGMEALANELRLCPILYYLYFEYCTFSSASWPSNLFDGESQYFISVYSGTNTFPDAPSDGSLMYYIRFDYCAGVVPYSLPSSWAGLNRLRYLYLRRNGYSSTQVNSLAQQFSDLLDDGMGSAMNNNQVLYLNQAGQNENAPLTAIPSGWEAKSGYINRIGKPNQRIYHN